MLQTEIAWSKRTSRRSRKSARLKSDLPMHMLVRSSFKVCTGQFYCYPIKGVLNIKHFYKLFINLCVHSTHSSGPLSVMWIPFLWTHTAKHNNTKSFFMTFDVHAQIKRNTEKNTHTRNQRENERKRGKIDRRGFDDIVYYRETRKRKRKGKLKMIRPILNGQVFVPIYFCVYFVYDHKIKVGKRRRKHVFNCRLFWTVLDRCLQSYIYWIICSTTQCMCIRQKPTNNGVRLCLCRRCCIVFFLLSWNCCQRIESSSSVIQHVSNDR